MKAVILAGGLGTRLRPFIVIIYKPPLDPLTLLKLKFVEFTILFGITGFLSLIAINIDQVMLTTGFVLILVYSQILGYSGYNFSHNFRRQN